MTIVFSRPIRSDSQPKNGRVRPLVIRSSDRASGSSGRPNTIALAIPKSRVNAAICEVTINPAVDIIVIMTNISQKIGVRNMSAGRTSRDSGLGTRDSIWDLDLGIWDLGFADFN